MRVFPRKLFVLFVVSLFIQGNLAQYEPPTPSVEPLYPKGIRMSIPHEDGITLVAYHVKFNEDFNGLEAGTIARDIVRVRNGRWTYEDHTTRLKRGQIIYYWIHVVYDGLGYNKLDGQHVVNQFYNYDGTPVEEVVTTNIVCATPTETRIFDNDLNPTQKRQNVCPGQLLFEDNFDSLDTNRWTLVERFSDGPNYEFVVYMNNNTNVWDGVLHITPTPTSDVYGADFIRQGTLNLEKCTAATGTTSCKQTGHSPYILPPVISGRLNSKRSFRFLYGRVEVRAKLPRGDWIYPLLTLESMEVQEGTKPYCEIILAHAFGNSMLMTDDGDDLSGHVLQGGGHLVSGDRSKQHNRLNLPNKRSDSMWSDSYHVYELEWKRGLITLKVDGQQYGEHQLPPLYEIPLYLNFGVGVGGHILFPNSCKSNNYTKPWKNVSPKAMNSFFKAENTWSESWKQSDTGLHIDYVKVWAL